MKSIQVIIILVLFSINLSAQTVSYSVDAGTNYSFFSLSKFQSLDNSTVNSSGKFGFHFSNNFTFTVNEYLAIKTGLGFSSINSDYRFIRGVSDTQISLFPSGSGNNQIVLYDDYDFFTNPVKVIGNPYYQIYQLNTPMQIRLALFKEKLLLFSGVSMSTIIQAKLSYDTEPGKRSYKAEDDLDIVYFNANFGVEYNLLKKLYAGIFYEYNLTNIVNERFAYDSSKIHLHSLSLNLSYKF